MDVAVANIGLEAASAAPESFVGAAARILRRDRDRSGLALQFVHSDSKSELEQPQRQRAALPDHVVRRARGAPDREAGGT